MDSYLIALKMLKKQIASLTAYELSQEDEGYLEDILKSVAVKMDVSLDASNIKQAHDKEGNPCFNPYHHGQYAVFLVMLGNAIKNDNVKESFLPDIIDYINTTINNMYITCKMDIPEIFYFDHPMGSVIGRAKIGNYFHMLQGCTIGASRNKSELAFPTLGEHVVMCANSSILGNSTIGCNVIISTGTVIKDEDVPSNCIAFGQSPGLIIKDLSEEKAQMYIREFWRK